MILHSLARSCMYCTLSADLPLDKLACILILSVRVRSCLPKVCLCALVVLLATVRDANK